MLVTLGDGRKVECASGITKLPPGPAPEVLDSHVQYAETSSGTIRGTDQYVRMSVMRRGFDRNDPRRPRRQSSELGAIQALFGMGAHQ